MSNEFLDITPSEEKKNTGNTADAIKKKRGGFRFQLGTLLGAITIFCAGMGVVHSYLEHTKRYDRETSAKNRLGEKITRSYLTPYRSLWQKILKEDKEIYEGMIFLKGATDEDMVSVRQFEGLHTLILEESHVTAAGLRHLQRLSELDDLMMHGPLDKEMIQEINGLSLKELYLSKSGMTDELLQKLDIPDLERLSVEDTSITDDGLKNMRRFRHMNSLNVSKTRVTGSGIATLKQMPSLKTLLLCELNLTGEELGCIKVFPKLDWLWLENNPVTDKGMETLGNLNLYCLHLDKCPLSDDMLRHFREHPTLTMLSVCNTPITMHAQPHLKTMHGTLESFYAKDTPYYTEREERGLETAFWGNGGMFRYRSDRDKFFYIE